MSKFGFIFTLLSFYNTLAIVGLVPYPLQVAQIPCLKLAPHQTSNPGSAPVFEKKISAKNICDILVCQWSENIFLV